MVMNQKANQLDPKFLQILRCPLRSCRADLISSQNNNDRSLKCTNCGACYPIICDIPVLFPNQNYSPETHIRHWDLKENAASYARKYNGYEKKQGTPWGLYTHTSEMRAIDKLVKKVKLDLTDKTIFDAGCGNGRLLSFYGQAKNKIGLDASLELLIDLKRRHPDYWLVCAQLEDMPFEDAISDFTASIRVFQHIKSPEQAYSEMVRLTKPSGYISLELYNKLNLKELYKKFRMWKPINKLWSWGLDYDRYYSYREIESWSRDNFIKTQGYSGAGWGIHFYLFEPLKFRGLAPHWLQKPVYCFFLKLEDILGLWPFFNKTLEKVCFIGSQQTSAKKPFYIKRITNRFRRKKEIKQAKKLQNQLTDRNYVFVGSDFKHLEQTINWLKQAQDATPDGGVSRGYGLVKDNKTNSYGWQPSYPETSGYIIPTFLKAAELLSSKDLIRRAILMADWELNIIYPDGAVHGGNITALPNKAIFDTGQVIRGLSSIHKQTGKTKYLDAAIKSADWILQSEHDKQGHWQTNSASSVSAETTTYYTYAIAPLAELGLEQDKQKYIDLARRVGNYTLSKQNMDGWFDGADFKQGDDYLLHPLAYTIDGLLDIGILLKEEKFIHAAKHALNQILKNMEENGRIPARLDKNWQPAASYACLTGIAQIAISSLKIFEYTKHEWYYNKAHQAKEYLKACQNNMDNAPVAKGALWGSWPICGDYGKYQALNWPPKFMADLLMKFIKLEQKK
ncbi:hypothetical protein A3B87_00120 [Candidatus Kuenenbacteria bacterium RIFCSPHIGHO2_02_FULL_39_13]|uniref:Methyltransferase type 11 domain-containing protein n=1 Tax=Candidatus Kuenenbacteria bacterium RIFCSPHIGHO2_02_FULL_39_13 TaxID=1798561 RepID=A0A1F6FN31_9BACT|nr:MAG: hypothetical protein A3B87_00120 [Candidatus Kuenenbacteria bacterium RIFCSPHIGHO2_02_FULL_39_13]